MGSTHDGGDNLLIGSGCLSSVLERCLLCRLSAFTAEQRLDFTPLAKVPAVQVTGLAPPTEIIPPATGPNGDEGKHKVGVGLGPCPGDIRALLDDVADPGLRLSAADGQVTSQDRRIVHVFPVIRQIPDSHEDKALFMLVLGARPVAVVLLQVSQHAIQIPG